MRSPTLPIILQTTSLLASTTLFALSVATVYLTLHYTNSIDARVPGDTYTWHGSLGSPERAAYLAAVDSGGKDFEKVVLEYVTSNDVWVLVSGCVGLIAGVAGWLTVCFTMLKAKSPKTAGSRFPWVLACSIFFGLAAFVMSLASSIMTFQTKTRLQGFYCNPRETIESSNRYFDCTRELAACNIFENIYMEDMSWSRKVCNEATASRNMLIPTVICAVVLVVVWVAQAAFSRKRATADADLRVQVLQEDEE